MPVKAADGFELIAAFEFVGACIELDHHDQCRFSATKSIHPDQVIGRYHACHTARHAHDPSASRLP